MLSAQCEIISRPHPRPLPCNLSVLDPAFRREGRLLHGAVISTNMLPLRGKFKQPPIPSPVWGRVRVGANNPFGGGPGWGPNEK